MGCKLHYFVASAPPCVLQMDDGFRGGAPSHCGVFWVYLTVCVGSGVQLPAVNFRAMACACSMEIFFLESIIPFSILDFESRKIF